MPAPGWVDAGPARELDAAGRGLLEAGGRRILVLRAGSEWFAVEDSCTHARTSLADGDLDGYELECPLHGARFDIRDGRPLGLPAERPLPTYPVRRIGERIEVQVS